MTTRIEKLIRFLETYHPKKEQSLANFLKQLGLTENDVEPWADYGHLKEQGYGRKLVHEGKNFELMVMSWMPDDFSAVHNHGYTQWGAVQLFGHASHYVYKLEDTNSIRLVRKDTTEIGEILSVSHSFIHQMGNQTTKPYLTLHMYGVENEMDMTVTSDANIFEIEKGRIVKANGGAFFQLDERELKKCGTLQCNDETTLKEFATTILPKSLQLSDEKKQSIASWFARSLGSRLA